MLRACVIALLLVGCERKTTDEKPPPPPRDAQVIDAFVDEARASALDRLYTYVTTTPRPRYEEVEAPLELTRAYIDWMFAYGYARVGKPERSRELATAAKKGLLGVSSDPIHAVLSEMFAVRVAAGAKGKPRATLPPSVDAQLALFDRGDRYTIDRLREASRILAPGEGIDAISAFARRRKDVRGAGFDALRGVVDPMAREKLVTALFDELANIDERDRAAFVEGLIDECIALRAGALIDKALARILELPEKERAAPAAKLIVLAHVTASPRLGTLATQLTPSIAAADFHAAPLATLVRAKLPHDTLATIWRAVDAPTASERRTNSDGIAGRLAYAAGLAQLGDARATSMLADDPVVKPASGFYQLERIRMLALAYAQLPPAEGLPHALYPLAFVDALVVAVVDE